MTTAIDRKIAKIEEKIKALVEAKNEAEARKKRQFTADTEDFKDLVEMISSTAKDYSIHPKKVVQTLSAHFKGVVVAKREVAIKYRDTAPGCENNVWTGRGIKPLWLQRYVSNGKNINDFLVK